MAALDYILNRCTLREIDAISTAVERRRRDLASSTGILSLDPARAAREMSGTVRQSIESGMEGIRNTFREYAVNLIRKEAPELTDEQMAELVDAWMPDAASLKPGQPGSSGSPGASDMDFSRRDGADAATSGDRYRGLVHKGTVNGIPPDLMYEMVCQFVSYSTGSMGIAEEAKLREDVGDWTTLYWERFPKEIRACIKDFLSGSMTGGEMDATLSDLLQ